MTASLNCPAVLALELCEGSRPARIMLSPADAGALAERVANDLARLLPGVDALGLALVAALYDQAQLLRPGFALFAELAELYRGSQRNAAFTPGLLGLGAACGRLPSALLEPEPGLQGSSLLLLPFVLLGPPAEAGAIGQTMEEAFVERGLADAATSWALQQGFGLELAHARYMTLNDLAALCAIQLDHLGLAALWTLIERSLWPRNSSTEVRTPAGQPWAWRNGGIEYPALGYRAVQAAIGAGCVDAGEQAWVDWLLYQRQFQMSLNAHRIRAVPLAAETLDGWLDAPAIDDGLRVEWLLPPPGPGEAVDACLHEHPQLGGVAVSLGVFRGGRWQTCAHAYPLDPGAGPALLEALGLSLRPRALGRIAVDAQHGDLCFVPEHQTAH